MLIKLLMVGKNKDNCSDNGITDYAQRIERYHPFELKYLKEVKNTDNLTTILNQEAEILLKEIEPQDFVVLLDEIGKEYTSVQFSHQLDKWRLGQHKRLVFVAGSPYGFGQKIYDRCNGMLSLSKMTLTHHHARLLFAEQLYRAFTIIHRHPYHHI